MRSPGPFRMEAMPGRHAIRRGTERRRPRRVAAHPTAPSTTDASSIALRRCNRPRWARSTACLAASVSASSSSDARLVWSDTRLSRVLNKLSKVPMPDSRNTGVSATWMTWAMLTTASPEFTPGREPAVCVVPIGRARKVAATPPFSVAARAARRLSSLRLGRDALHRRVALRSHRRCCKRAGNQTLAPPGLPRCCGRRCGIGSRRGARV